MAHPDRAFPFHKEPVEQRPRLATELQFCMAELPLAGRDDLPAKVTAHQLHAVADPQNRHSQFEEILDHCRRPGLVDRLGATREYYPGRTEGADRRQVHVKGVQLAIDMCLAHSTGNQLGVLGTKIEDQDLLAVDVWHCQFFHNGTRIITPPAPLILRGGTQPSIPFLKRGDSAIPPLS
jgi:hypothetical protein